MPCGASHALLDTVPDVRRGGAPCAHRPARVNRPSETARSTRPSAQSSDESSSSVPVPVPVPVSVSGFGGLGGFGRAPGLSRR